MAPANTMSRLFGFAVIYRTIHSPFGQVLKAIRENESRAISLGYRVDLYKLLAFTLSAALAGLLFVAVSINLTRILQVPGRPGRAGEAIVLRSRGSARVALGRFSDGYPVQLSPLSPRRPATLQLPEDGYAGPWRLSIIGDRPVEACPAGAAESA